MDGTAADFKNKIIFDILVSNNCSFIIRHNKEVLYQRKVKSPYSKDPDSYDVQRAYNGIAQLERKAKAQKKSAASIHCQVLVTSTLSSTVLKKLTEYISAASAEAICGKDITFANNTTK